MSIGSILLMECAPKQVVNTANAEEDKANKKAPFSRSLFICLGFYTLARYGGGKWI
jgi:hypothetical protein